MRILSSAVLICILSLLAFTQTSTSKWQSGLVTAVTLHDPTQTNSDDGKQYDVTVRVGDMLYVALYTAPAGSETVKYRVGVSTQVLVEKNTITFNDLLGRANKLPILHRETATAGQEQ